MKIDYFQSLEVYIFTDKQKAGNTAGKAVEEKIIEAIQEKGSVRIIFAAAPSQNEMLDYLSQSKNIDWSCVYAFNMDEYLDMDKDNPKSFSNYLYERLFKKVDNANFNFLNGKAPEEKEIKRYADLLNESPIDIVCFGIGENGHLAFNDPSVARFDDPFTVKVVELDDQCRLQQVNEECFETLDEVPRKALTITIPAIMQAQNLIGVVTGKNKYEAVYNTLEGPLSTDCPASIVRNHPNCVIFLDEEAYQNKVI